MEGRKIGVELRSLNNMMMRFVESTASKRELDAITGTNGWIIGFLAQQQGQAVFQRDLEKAFGITRSTASKVVDLMVKKGLVERHSVAYDARLRQLVLTEKAWAVANVMQTEGEGLERRLLEGFSAREIEQLTDYICRMKQNMREGCAQDAQKRERRGRVD